MIWILLTCVTAQVTLHSFHPTRKELQKGHANIVTRKLDAIFSCRNNLFEKDLPCVSVELWDHSQHQICKSDQKLKKA